jgi:hypothetical protein
MMAKALKIAAALAIGCLLLASGQPEQKPADASPVIVSAPPGVEAQLRTELAQAIAERDNARAAAADRDAAARKYQDAHHELLLKQSSTQPIRPQPVAYVTRSAPANCANGSCRVMPAQAPRQYQQRTYRSGPIRRWLGR